MKSASHEEAVLEYAQERTRQLLGTGFTLNARAIGSI